MDYDTVCCKENHNRVFLVNLVDDMFCSEGAELKVALINDEYVLVDRYDDEDFCLYYPRLFIKGFVKDITPLQQLELVLDN